MPRSPSRSTFCALALIAFAACAGSPPGTSCSADDECRENLRCVPDSYGGTRCMATCEAGTRLCTDGGACLASPSGETFCWFGGNVPHDEIGRAHV